MRISIKDYYEKTPPVMRKIGDSISLSCSGVTAYALLGNYHTLGGIALCGVILGKFLTNCFSEDKNDS